MAKIFLLRFELLIAPSIGPSTERYPTNGSWIKESQVNIKCFSQSMVVPITERIRIVGALVEGSDSYLADPVFHSFVT